MHLEVNGFQLICFFVSPTFTPPFAFISSTAISTALRDSLPQAPLRRVGTPKTMESDNIQGRFAKEPTSRERIAGETCFASFIPPYPYTVENRKPHL